MIEPERPHGPPPAPAAEDAALRRHRDALREAFPLPDAAALAKRKPPAMPAALAIAALLLGTLLWADPAWHTQHYATGIGEQRQLQLGDGSRIVLDTGSRLDVSWHLRSRRSVLEQGRALFEVAPGPWRPFTVEAGTTRIRVVGTVFEVRRQAAGAAVTVLHGRVRVADVAGAAVELVAGQQSVPTGTRIPTVASVDVASRTAWKEGRMVFDRTPLDIALAEIQRYRKTPVHLQDPALGSLRVSGTFSVRQTDALLDLLPQALPVTVIRSADGSARILPKQNNPARR